MLYSFYLEISIAALYFQRRSANHSTLLTYLLISDSIILCEVTLLFFSTIVIILKESIRFRADNKRAVLEKIELL